jgi:transposase
MTTWFGFLNVSLLKLYVIQAPVLNPVPGTSSSVECDNARVHVNDEVTAAITTRGAALTALPAYSPEFNPVELFFNTIKCFIRRNGQSFYDRGMDDVQILEEAIKDITVENVNSWIRYVASRY